jgi:hypothetical protein
MRLLPILTVLAGISAVWPVFAQTPGSTTPLYTTTPPEELDKNFGLPSFGMPNAELPQQRTQAPKASPSDVPDFFQAPSGLVSSDQKTSDQQTSDAPDFFKGGTDFTLPRARKTPATGADMETPLFTTNEGASKDRLETDDTPSGDTANAADQ